MDVEALKQRLQHEGFDAYEWNGHLDGTYLDYIYTQDEVVCIPSDTADMEIENSNETVKAADRINVSANTYQSITVTGKALLVVLTGNANKLKLYFYLK